MRKRSQDWLRRAQQKQLRRRRLKELLGQTVRRRLKAVRYYRHYCGSFSFAVWGNGRQPEIIVCPIRRLRKLGFRNTPASTRRPRSRR
jgi:hypothetical protein